MTRVTNFGIKRTYVQAGFADAAAAVEVPVASEPASEAQPVPPPKKKRKRTKMSQRDGNKAKNAALQEGAEPTAETTTPAAPAPKPAPSTKKPKPKKCAANFRAVLCKITSVSNSETRLRVSV